MSKEFILDRSHPNSNVHGIVGTHGEKTCYTEAENLCTGCCYTLDIKGLKDENIIFLSGGTVCEAQIPGAGCNHILSGNEENRFPRCSSYHCSEDIKMIKGNGISPSEKGLAKKRLAWVSLGSQHLGEISVEQMQDNNVFLDEFLVEK